MKTSLFLSGIPTKPDVDKLRKAFGVPAEGVVITYAQLSEVIGSDPKSHRFKTVVGHWRKVLLSEHRVWTAAERGTGIYRMNPNEEAEASVCERKAGFRKLRKSARLILGVDRSRLTPENVRIIEHGQRILGAVELAASTAAKELPAVSLETRK